MDVKGATNSGDVTIKIGAHSTYGEFGPRPEEDPAAQQLAANALINILPIETKQRIYAITKAVGQCRKSQRATKSLVRRGIKTANRSKISSKHDVEVAKREDDELFLRVQARLARGVDRPYPGMTQERYEAIKAAYIRVEATEGLEIPQGAKAFVCKADNRVILVKVRG